MTAVRAPLARATQLNRIRRAWLALYEFAYAPLDHDSALVRLLAGVDPHRVPTDATLLAARDAIETWHPAAAHTIAERSASGLLWEVCFELPLEVVEWTGVGFTLVVAGRPPLTLPLPELRPELIERDRRPAFAGPRRYLVALGAGVAVLGASGAAARSAAADATPPSSTATPATTTTTTASTTATTTTASTTTTTSAATTTATTTAPTATTTPAAPAKASIGKAIKIQRLHWTHPRSDSTKPAACTVVLARTKKAAASAKHKPLTAADRSSTCAPATISKKKKHHPSKRHHGRKHAKRSAHAQHPSGGAGLTAPPNVQPNDAKHQKPAVAVPAPVPAPPTVTAPTTPTAVSVWSGGLNIDPFTAAQLKRFSLLVANLGQPPKFLIPIYKAAGRRYHVQWEILAAINAIETNFGRDLAVSPKGAAGWMQFVPGTWMQYGVAIEGSRHFSLDGSRAPNPYDPRDAIFSAARYLHANGAPRHIRRALFAYNHARWYVDAVLWRAQLITDHALGRRAAKDGYALPLDARYMRNLGRTDDGVDIEDAPDGAAVYSMTPGIVTAVASDPTGFGPNYPVVLVTKGPLAGQYVYYGHVAASLVHVGQRVIAGQPIAVMGHTGDAASLDHGHIEIGFSDASGDPLNHHGTIAWTPSGDAMRHVLGTLTTLFLAGPDHAARRLARTAPVPFPSASLIARLLRR